MAYNYKKLADVTLVESTTEPNILIEDSGDIKKISASNIATKETSGISNPSLNKLIPTNTSNSPKRRLRIISILSNAFVSECM